MRTLSLGWVTSDWVGGSNYGPYSLREALRIIKKTKHLDDFDRQSLGLSLVYRWDAGYPNIRLREWTFDVSHKSFHSHDFDMRIYREDG